MVITDLASAERRYLSPTLRIELDVFTRLIGRNLRPLCHYIGPSIVHAFAQSLVCAFARSPVRAFAPSVVHAFARSFISALAAF